MKRGWLADVCGIRRPQLAVRAGARGQAAPAGNPALDPLVAADGPGRAYRSAWTGHVS